MSEIQTEVEPAGAPTGAAAIGNGPRVACAVKLPVFEGPLDLLLHLIRANEVDVADIPIAIISEQYLSYLELMKMLDIDVAAEYLLMAATLAHIKSRMLLPRDPDDTDDEEEDPRAELARRLAEYAVFQEAAGELAQRPRLGRDVFENRPDRSSLPQREEVLSVSLFALLEAMHAVLQRVPAETRHHQVALERIRLQDRMVWVMDRLRGSGDHTMRFEDLLDDGAPTREKVVVTFLSILELAKIQALRIFQNLSGVGEPQGPVRVRLSVDGAPDDTEIARAAERAETELAQRVNPGEAEGVPAAPTASADGHEGDDGE